MSRYIPSSTELVTSRAISMLDTMLYISGESYRIDTIIEYVTNSSGQYRLCIDFEISDYNNELKLYSLSLINHFPDQIRLQCISQEGKPNGITRILTNATRTQEDPPDIVTFGLGNMNEAQRLRYWLKGWFFYIIMYFRLVVRRPHS